MRRLFTWLLTLAILVGLGGRVVAAAQTEHHCAPQTECCDSAHSHAPGGHQHDDKCPADHHHCGTCLHQIPLGLEGGPALPFTTSAFSLTQLRPESERAPEGPFQALDKPPLI